MTAPDRDLLAAVGAAVNDKWRQQNTDALRGRWPVEGDLATGALAAAGRVLAERLRDRADTEQANAETCGDPTVSALCYGESFYRDAADLVARWCGAEPEGAAPGNTPSPACTDSFHAALVDRFDAMVAAGCAERDEAAASEPGVAP